MFFVSYTLLQSSCSSNESVSETEQVSEQNEEENEEENETEEEQVIPCNSTEIFANESTNTVCFEIENNIRKVYTNNWPAHEFGPFAGRNDIEAQDFEYSMCLYPELTNTITDIGVDPNSANCNAGIIFGVSNQGINYSPFARLYFVNPNTQQENTDWHIEADFTLAMDLNGGHVNGVSRYHYHNIPQDYFENDLNIDGSNHSPIMGYAADGFPIYYKYVYTDENPSSQNPEVSSFHSGYSLKQGTRPGNGITAPNGVYDGTYIEDYEYTGSDLDECGGRYGVTPEYPNGTYYYVLTDNWPYIPRCFKGKYVDNSFQVAPTCPDSTAEQDCSDNEVLANVNVFTILKKELDAKMYHKINTLEFGGSFDRTAITKIQIYEMDGNLAFDSKKKLDVYASLNKAEYFVHFSFDNGQLTRKIIM